MHEDRIRFFLYLFMCGVSEDAEQANFNAKLVTIFHADVCVCVCTCAHTHTHTHTHTSPMSQRIQYYLRLQINVRMQ